jgi:hypothetical protein
MHYRLKQPPIKAAQWNNDLDDLTQVFGIRVLSHIKSHEGESVTLVNQEVAHLGDWIVEFEDEYMPYSDSAFWDLFEPDTDDETSRLREALSYYEDFVDEIVDAQGTLKRNVQRLLPSY